MCLIGLLMPHHLPHHEIAGGRPRSLLGIEDNWISYAMRVDEGERRYPTGQ